MSQYRCSVSAMDRGDSGAPDDKQDESLNKVKPYKNTIPQSSWDALLLPLFMYFLQVFNIADIVHQVSDSQEVVLVLLVALRSF